jgi:NAD(P)-dependent dehydrogenase (short-subunit alcohol dehydrogenase family)
MRVIIAGANRGIGLELVRQLAARGEDVEAACRRPHEAGELAGADKGQNSAVAVRYFGWYFAIRSIRYSASASTSSSSVARET